MKRRSILQATLVSAAASAAWMNSAIADSKAEKQASGKSGGGKFAGAVYYTKENPGRWEKKVAGHVPVIQVERKQGTSMATVTTPHEMTAQHYIVKHTLLDQHMNVLGEQVFYPDKNKAAISSYDIKDYKGKLYAVSLCNKHDTWVAESRV